MIAQTKPKSIIKEVVLVQSLIEAHISLIGKVSNRQYTWAKSGDIVSVDKQDADNFLKMRLGKRQCCGDSGNYIFQVGGNNA